MIHPIQLLPGRTLRDGNLFDERGKLVGQISAIKQPQQAAPAQQPEPLTAAQLAGIARVQAEEKQRWKTVITSPEFPGREKLAFALLGAPPQANYDLTASDVIGILRKAPREQAVEALPATPANEYAAGESAAKELLHGDFGGLGNRIDLSAWGATYHIDQKEFARGEAVAKALK